LLVALTVTLAVYSQEPQEKEYQTIFDNKDLRISGMGGPFMQFTGIAGEFGHMMGGGGGVLLNDFFFGGYGLGLTNAIPDYVNGNSNDRLSLGHGGFWMGYSLFGEKSIHLNISSLIGWGEFGIIQYDGYYPFIRDQIFTVAPTIEVELNLTRYLRIGAGASYNLYAMVDQQLHGYRSGDLSSPGGFLSFKFGWF
ncbi:MAG: hypothetical protein KAT15_31920, partial [Bacteroidales bacterium]|nr:hypothetical protein [Bacteroidales bacterium]